MDLDLLVLRELGIALFLGALVGVDREQKPGRQFGGLRTFMLISLAGATAAWLSEATRASWLFPAGLFSLACLFIVAHWSRNQGLGKETRPGLTTEIAGLVVYLLGGACTLGYTEVAVVIGIVTSALLTFKTPLHEVVAALGPDDIPATLKLLFATFVVLPILPDAPVDPWGVLNPFKLWWLVVLVSALSLLGYLAVRMLGERRGLLLTGFFGGLVSSTAVTWTAARQAREGTAGPDALSASILLAWTLMFARVPLEVAVVNPALLSQVLLPMAAMGVVTAICAGVLAMRGTHHGSSAEDVPFKNPFSLWEAVKFGLLFAAVLLVVEGGRRMLDDSWQYAIAAVAGSTDVDAITLTMAESALRGMDEGVAVTAIVVAAVTNTVVKTGIAVWAGGKPLGLRVTAAAVLSAAAGLAAVLLLPRLW